MEPGYRGKSSTGIALHEQGQAHSSELWLDQHLVAGAYGVSLGKMFYGESMFSLIPDGSKVALSYLIDFCATMASK